MNVFARIVVSGCLSAAICFPAAAQQSQPEASSMMERLLNGPERRDIPWTVKLSRPALTYQQRYLVVVSASLNASVLRKLTGHQFIFEVKLADREGKWYRGEDLAEFKVSEKPPQPINSANFYTGVYALPGEYRVAAVIYDRTQGAANVRRLDLHVPEVKGSVLPDLTRGLLPVEFPTRSPGMNQNQDLRMERDPGWSLARGIEHLPIANTRPLRVDVVLDFSEPEGVTPENREQAMLGGKLSQRVYFEYLREMLPVGTIISHLQPSHGCVRVSAIDVSRVHVILDRQDAMRIDWAKLEKELYSVDLDRVDVATMTQQRDRSKFAAEFLTQIATDPAACGAGVEPVDHAVVLVSERQQYPRHTPVTPIQQEECPNCRFIYLRLTPYQFEPGDPYRDILKFLHPRSFQFYTPEGFRKVLQDLTAELSSPSSP